MSAVHGLHQRTDFIERRQHDVRRRRLEAALFQWINPKALTLAFGVVSAFTTVGGKLWLELTVIALVFALACFPALVVWCLFGVAIRQFLSSPRALRITNLVLAALVALSVVMLFV